MFSNCVAAISKWNKNNKCFDYIYVEETHISNVVVFLRCNISLVATCKWLAKAEQPANL